jgi:hypothetical protein
MGTVALRQPRLMFKVEYGISRPTRRRFHGDLPSGPSRFAGPRT